MENSNTRYLYVHWFNHTIIYFCYFEHTKVKIYISLIINKWKTIKHNKYVYAMYNFKTKHFNSNEIEGKDKIKVSNESYCILLLS